MRCLLFTTEEISFKTGQPSDRPIGICSKPSPDDETVFQDVVVSFLCVEAGDTALDAQKMAEEIRKFSADLVKRRVLLVPFAHLSNSLAKQPDLDILFEEVATSLDKCGLLKGRLGVGFHRSLLSRWETRKHKCSVAFRDSKHGSPSVDFDKITQHKKREKKDA